MYRKHCCVILLLISVILVAAVLKRKGEQKTRKIIDIKNPESNEQTDSLADLGDTRDMPSPISVQ